PGAFLDNSGQALGREPMLQRMEEHIQTLVGRDKNRIPTWDVVNEAIEDDGKLRETSWLKQVGPDYIEHAFNLAHKADPKAHLLYNDYNTFKPEKRAGIVKMAKQLQARNVPIHGLGM